MILRISYRILEVSYGHFGVFADVGHVAERRADQEDVEHFYPQQRGQQPVEQPQQF